MAHIATRIRRPLATLVTLVTLACPVVAAADSISVSPTRLMVPGQGQQTSLTIKADGAARSVVQVRVYRWQEGTSANRLYETRDVVVSPPMAQVGPRQELTVRILRPGGPARARECYRVLVDRVPDAVQQRQQVALRIRHSVPLCFGA